MNQGALWWGLLFGSIGLSFFGYGKRQKGPVPLVCGFGLMMFPYFVSNWLMMLIGAALIAIPYFVRL